MKRNKLFMFLFFFASFIFSFTTILIAGTPNLSAYFNSNGELINGWYWLRDISLQHYSQWIFENIPSGDYDLVLDITALATDLSNGRNGFPADILLIYETPGGKALVRQKVTLSHISLPNDSVGYTCNSQVTIPRLTIQDSTVLFVRVERILPEDNHIAFNAGSMVIMRSAESAESNSKTIISQGYIADKFNSNGSMIKGWYWLRDSALNHYAEWYFENIPAGESDLTLDITSLATDAVNGGKGYDSQFLLIYGFPGAERMGGVLKTLEVTLPNISPPNDPVGYTCNGLVTIPRNFITGATTFFFRIERINPDDNHLAFNQNSILLFTEE